MRPVVQVRGPDGRLHELGHGDVVGRLVSAALFIDDPRVSEAHAMVSHRGEALVLLALRRPIALDGRQVSEIVLEEGQVVTLAPGVDLEVVAVDLPDTVAAIVGDGLPRQVLPPVASLIVRPHARLVPRYEPVADAWLWSTSDGWHLRVADVTRALAAGERFQVGDRTFRLTHVPLEELAGQATEVDGGLSAPLRVVARFDTVNLHRDGRPALQLTGVSARIVSELAAVGGPLGWEALCAQLWRGEPDRQKLRHRLDVGLLRLRRTLREAGVRTDLVRAGGTGLIELALAEADTLVNEG